MADVGEQSPECDPPTVPFRKIVLPTEGAPTPARPSGPSAPPQPAPAQPARPAPAEPGPSARADVSASALTQPFAVRPAPPAGGAQVRPSGDGGPAGPAPGGVPAEPPVEAGSERGGAQGGSPEPSAGAAFKRPYGGSGAVVEEVGSVQEPAQKPSKPKRSKPKPPAEWRQVWPQVPQAAPAMRTSGARTADGPRPVPPRRRLGDIPMKLVYLLGAIVATVLAVVLVFTVFSGDVPTRNAAEEQLVGVEPVPTVPATPTPSASPTPTPTPIVLPRVPASKPYATFPGTPSVVIGLVNDERVGISYPKLAAPWQAVKSPSPFSAAQRVGKEAVPHTQIASAMLPGDAPEKKPASDADYRAIAAQAVRWTMRTQYPKGATLAWTASQRVPVGKGWTLGYKVTYTSGGKKRQAQAMVTVVEVGKTKPAMLMASVLDTDKAHWADLNTLVQRVRPL